MQINPDYGQLFKSNQGKENAKPAPDRTRVLTPLEKNALAEAKKNNRQLTNGDFTAGLEGWNVEGGASAFRTFQQGDGKALTTYGEHQEADTGRLFQCFLVPEDASKLTFKVHGGKNREQLYVALWRGDYRHALITSRNDNTPLGHQLDLKVLRNEIVTLEIVDHSAAAWGFIGAEDFRIVLEENSSPPPTSQSAAPKQSPSPQQSSARHADHNANNLIHDPSLEETPLGKLPQGWSAWLNDGPDFKCEVVEGGVTGEHCLRITGKGTRGVVFCGLNRLDRTKRYALKGRVKFEGGAEGRTILKFNYFRDGKWLGVNELVGVGSDDEGWQHIEKTDVANTIPEATMIVPTCHIEGNGAAYFDDLELVAFDRANLPADFDATHGKNNRPNASLDFDRWVGRWETTSEYRPTAAMQRRSVKGDTIVRQVLDDRFLFWEWASEADDSQYFAILGFDENVGGYHLWLFGSGGEAYQRIGQWDAAAQTLSLQLKPPSPGVTGTSVDRFVDEDRIESTLLVKSADGEVARDMRATWIRKSSAAPGDLGVSAGPAADPQELAVLDKLAGDWTVRVTNKPSVWFPKGESKTTTEQADWVLDGRFLLIRTYDERKEMTMLALMTYEPAEKSFHYWHFAKDVWGGQWRIAWDDSSRSFHWRSIDMPAGWIGAAFNRWIDEDTFDNQALIKDDQGRVLLDLQQEKKRKE